MSRHNTHCDTGSPGWIALSSRAPIAPDAARYRDAISVLLVVVFFFFVDVVVVVGGGGGSGGGGDDVVGERRAMCLRSFAFLSARKTANKQLNPLSLARAKGSGCREPGTRRPSFSRRGCASAFVRFSSAGWHTQESAVCVELG